MKCDNNKKSTSLTATAESECEIARQIEPLLYTKAQAAEMLGLKESSIEWLLRKKAIPHRKVSGKIRFTKSDLQALIDASAVTQCRVAIQKGA
ncbi:MAG: helix-turn-helix domain-containing protein [Sedimentisphaerales bacterium]|nr:helix-turn-helix domain-containing protein [Sedimentisphaerales bacterium]